MFDINLQSQSNFDISFDVNTSPSVTLSSPADTGSTSDTTPDLVFMGTDADADDIRYQIQIDTVNTFDSQSPGVPTVSAATTTSFTTSVTSMPVNLPSVSSGELLIAAVGVRNAGTWTPPSGWTLLAEQAGGGSVGETGVWYRIADGTEGATATWTAGTATTAAWHVRKVTNWHGTTPPEYTSTNGDAVSVDPPSITPSWGGTDTAFIVFAGSSADSMTFSGAPTNYSDLSSTTASSGGGASNMGSATRATSSTTENPSAFTTSTNRWWAAFTIAVRPAASGGGSLIDATSGTDAGFSGTPDNTDPFASGQQVTYTVQSALAVDTYYWRVRGLDPSGSNTYGAWSSTRSFDVTSGGSYTLTADGGSFVITGTSAGLERNLKVVADAGSIAITGTAANLEYSRKIVADIGTFLITGTDANLESSREVFAESGSVIITGTDATLRKSINMTADSGSFAVTGTNALLTATRRLTASSGSVAITGTDASFRKSINFIAESGAFSVAGTNANLEYNRRLVADSGVFDITGTNASLESSREVFAESGSVAISGTSASLTVHRRMTANSGSYSILGTAVALELARRLLADSGTVEITGTDATLDYQQGYFLNAESGSIVITGTPTRITFDVIPTIQGRSYYIDSNGSVYWVISENIGLVEKV